MTYLSGELLTRSLSSGGLAGGLLGTGHYCGEKKEQNVSCGIVLVAGDEETMSNNMNIKQDCQQRYELTFGVAAVPAEIVVVNSSRRVVC